MLYSHFMSSFLLVASDIHSDSQALEKLLNLASNKDCHALLYCGDLDTDNWEISQLLLERNCTVIPVLGNCDSSYSWRDCNFASVPYFRKAEFFGFKIFLTHGHYCSYPSDVGLNDLDFNLVLNGHSHVPVLEKREDFIFMNPGSAARPRGYSVKSYGRIDFSETSIKLSLHALSDDSVISELPVILH